MDSVQTSKEKKRGRARVVARLHSLGQFSYGGRLVSDNPVLDLNFTYDRKAWGFQVFKAMDLVDRSTPINFTLAVLNRNFHFGKRITITPSAGVILEQSESIADHGSDATIILTTAFKVSGEFTIDQSMFLGNLWFDPELKDWVNRIRLLYSRKHLDLTAACWYNNRVFDSSDYVTCGGSIYYSRIKLADHFSIHIGLNGLVVPYTSDEEINPAKNGVYLTIAAVFQ